MNLSNFLKKVDTICGELTREQMADFIHEWARSVTAKDRIEFLSLLSDGRISPASEEQTSGPDGLQSETERILTALARVEDGEMCLDSSLREDDGYYEEEDGFVFEDPDDIAGLIQYAADTVHQYVDHENNRDAFSIGSALLHLHVSVEGDYTDDSDAPMTLSLLKKVNLSRCDIRRLAVETILSAYDICPEEKRPATLYELFICADHENVSFYGQSHPPVTFAEVQESAEKELPDLQKFLQTWIDYLGNIAGQPAQRLIAETVLLLSDRNAAVRAAQSYADIHPCLYQQIFLREKDGAEASELLKMGQEALLKVKPNLFIRSGIALSTAEQALKTGHPTEAEHCWLEAFRSETVPVNYLRLCTESRDFSQYQEAAREIYRAHQTVRYRPGSLTPEQNELAENVLTESDFHTLLFFDGEFQYLAENVMNAKTPLGWSHTFMKQGISLFLLYLYRGENPESGISDLCVRMAKELSFTRDTYAKGLVREITLTNEKLFWERFQIWREGVEMPDAFQEKMLERLRKWLEWRVEGVMSESRRNVYSECAAFAAALAEVRESRGIGGKQADLLSWRGRYPRRTAFHQELRRFGMRDGKR